MSKVKNIPNDQEDPDYGLLNEAEFKAKCLEIISCLKGCGIQDAIDRLTDTANDIFSYTDDDRQKDSKFIFKHPELIDLVKEISFGDAIMVLFTAKRVLTGAWTLLPDYTVVNFKKGQLLAVYSIAIKVARKIKKELCHE
jgi:hypothetical protein